MYLHLDIKHKGKCKVLAFSQSVYTHAPRNKLGDTYPHPPVAQVDTYIWHQHKLHTTLLYIFKVYQIITSGRKFNTFLESAGTKILLRIHQNTSCVPHRIPACRGQIYATDVIHRTRRRHLPPSTAAVQSALLIEVNSAWWKT